MSPLPSWLSPDPEPLELWPTRELRDDPTAVALAVPRAWDEPVLSVEGPVTVLRLAGRIAGEGLVVARMDGAAADRDMTTWLNLPMSAVGGLDPQTLVEPAPTELLAWSHGEGTGVAERLGVDEAHVFSGLAKYSPVGDDPPELLRSYVLLLRRGSVAWKLALTLSSACHPLAEDDMVDANDHVRARACLASLALLGPAAP